MIQELEHTNKAAAIEIEKVFKLSYAVEAELLGAKEFPPLKRKLEEFIDCSNQFFGYKIDDRIAGITEIKTNPNEVHIQSLVVHPDFFRRGLGESLMRFVLANYETTKFMVETGVDNLPAIALYKKVGFKEVHQWDTKYGIRKIRLITDA